MMMKLQTNLYSLSTHDQKQSGTSAVEVKIQGEVPGKIYYESDSDNDWDDDDLDY